MHTGYFSTIPTSTHFVSGFQDSMLTIAVPYLFASFPCKGIQFTKFQLKKKKKKKSWDRKSYT